MTPGIDKISMESYLALKAFSAGLAHTILTRSPLHAWIESPWNPDRKQDNNKASDIGSIAHDVLLEGGTGLIERVDPNDYPAEKTGNIPDGWTNKAIRAARDSARAAGKIPLFPEDVDAVTAMVGEAKEFVARSELAGIFDNGAPELTAVWDDDGLLCKARPDWSSGDNSVWLHVKTTKRSVHPIPFERLCINMGYDISLMFYARAIKPEPRQFILAIEQDEPYACKLFALTPAQMAISAARVQRAMQTWAACIRADRFPAYSGEVHYIEPSPWQLAQAEIDAADTKFTDEELKGGIPL